jgi:hypothetical protein
VIVLPPNRTPPHPEQFKRVLRKITRRQGPRYRADRSYI